MITFWSHIATTLAITNQLQNTLFALQCKIVYLASDWEGDAGVPVTSEHSRSSTCVSVSRLHEENRLLVKKGVPH